MFFEQKSFIGSSGRVEHNELDGYQTSLFVPMQVIQ